MNKAERLKFLGDQLKNFESIFWKGGLVDLLEMSIKLPDRFRDYVRFSREWRQLSRDFS